MAEVITNAGERLIAKKQGNGEPLIIDRVILSHDPAIDPSAAIDRNSGIPGQDTITYQASVTKSAWVTPNEVVYSLFLGTDIGPFSFNRMDLVASSDNVNVAVSTFPVQQKIADNPGENIRGQNMTRNMVLIFDGARAITQITIEAEAWQWDFDYATANVAGLARIATQDEALSGIDPDKFITPYTLAYALNRAVFPGFIGMFAGTEKQISPGWQLCNGLGKTSNGIQVPDLRDRMIICAGGDYGIGDKGGSEAAYTSSDGSHSHSISVYGHTMSISETASHNHSFNEGHYITGGASGGSNVWGRIINKHDLVIMNTGGSKPHNHSASSGTVVNHSHSINTLSPYYALAMIIKL